LKANGLTHTSPGQRPGYDAENGQALKGRDKPRGVTFVSPLQGLNGVGAGYPGRCPGLVYCAPLGL